MDTERWKILLTAIDKGSLCEAGEVLGYTVSGVSRSVAALEKELGFSLLYRSKRGVAATEECKQLLPLIRELLFVQQKLEQTAAGITGADCGTIVIGTAYSSYYHWLTEVTAMFREKHPGVQFHFIYGASSELFTQLSEHRLDFALASKREGDFSFTKLCDDPQLAMVSRKHPLAALKKIPVDVFAREPFIETYPKQETDHSRSLKECNIKPNTQYTTTDISATYAMVSAGLGISINNRINSQPDYPNVVHIPLDPPQIIPIGLACNKELPPAAEAFFNFLQTQIPKECI